MQGKQPLFSFGVISDVQYADIPDGRSYLGVPRYYRHSMLVLQRAVRNWNNPDGYDISAIGWPQDHPKTLQALKILQEKNPNTDKNSPSGLVGLERRFVKFNGGISEGQLKWLDEILQDATKNGQKVVVCCHMPLDPGASSKTALCWNYD
ncbi:hypothetical protein C5167_034777 [Papaver somniferum]|uniref:Calcineurin-like phosphoesterase domain-containing protein n=1 Tax=Papaver somniferum TaxID=3469 RepID=A0A4Y7KEQ5_PAPSO|nr:hypothetical protein C5167_034777 [Papaver somniferum]